MATLLEPPNPAHVTPSMRTRKRAKRTARMKQHKHTPQTTHNVSKGQSAVWCGILREMLWNPSRDVVKSVARCCEIWDGLIPEHLHQICGFVDFSTKQHVLEIELPTRKQAGNKSTWATTTTTNTVVLSSYIRGNMNGKHGRFMVIFRHSRVYIILPSWWQRLHNDFNYSTTTSSSTVHQHIFGIQASNAISSMADTYLPSNT